MSRYISKAGKHGTLYRYAVPYGDPGSPVGVCYFWAYEAEGAELAFYDDNAEEFVITGAITRVRATVAVQS